MTVSFDQLPLEMRKAIVREMDVGTRVNLSMCSKSENQLVRSTKYGKVKWIMLDGNVFHVSFEHKRENKGLRVVVKPGEADWKEKIMNIMSLIGTTVKVEMLELETFRRFKEMFVWFRSNIQLNPQLVRISVHSLPDSYDESLWDWPSHTKFELSVYGGRLPNLERFNMYDRINSFGYWGGEYVESEDTVTDEDLKKLRYAERVCLEHSNVTIEGVIWWFEQWMTRTTDKEGVLFGMFFKRFHEISIEDFKNKLSSFIEKIEWCSGGEFGPDEDYWKIDIKKDGESVGAINLYKYKIHFEPNTNPVYRSLQDP